jgi:periplasmic protein TonB
LLQLTSQTGFIKINFLNNLINKKMKTNETKVPSLNEIVFEGRNKEYGAYKLRKQHWLNVAIGLLIGIIILCSATIIPYLRTKAKESQQARTERQVEIKMENLNQPNEVVAPPPPPPSQPVETAQPYVAPVVVDSIKPDEVVQLMSADQAQLEVKNEDVNVEIVEVITEEVQEEEPEVEPFIVVEEMPAFPGGEKALLDYIAANTIYPEVAKENNVQGKVVVGFCVTSKGGVDRVSVLKGVDPELDKEAIRVVKSLPAFKPGKQGGKPVPVWFSVPIKFELK